MGQGSWTCRADPGNVVVIVKIQKPLNGLPGDPFLIYDEQRFFKVLVPPTEKLRQVMGDQEKVYWEVQMVKDGFRLIREVPGQTW